MESVIQSVHLALSPEPLYATVNKRNRRSPPDGCSNVSPPGKFRPSNPQITPPPPPPPEFDDNFLETNLDETASNLVQELENRYGGKFLANIAATTIQRAYRSAKLQQQFDRLLRLAKSADRLDRRLSLLEPSTFDYDKGCYSGGSEINVDTGLAMKELSLVQDGEVKDKSRSASTLVPMDEIDRLILQAAGLSTFSSPNKPNNGPSARHIKNRKCSSKPNLSNVREQQQYLRRTTSLRLDRGIKNQKGNSRQHSQQILQMCHSQPRSKDDFEVANSPCPSPLPPPCPPLRGEGFYASPPTAPNDNVEALQILQNLQNEQEEDLGQIYVTRDDLYSNQNNFPLQTNDGLSRVELRRSSAPKPPQRTVSFLCNETFPRKVSQQKTNRNRDNSNIVQQSLQHYNRYNNQIQKTKCGKPGEREISHSRVMSYQEHLPGSSPPAPSLHNRSYDLAHNRSYSSPAPLSPQLPQHVPPPIMEHHISIQIEEEKVDFPLPPPPYISPPNNRKTESPPLPPPPAAVTPRPEPPSPFKVPVVPPSLPQTNLLPVPEIKPPCDSSSSTSSIDSGFRSSLGEHMSSSQPTSPTSTNPPVSSWIPSPNYIASPETCHRIKDVVFEPRSLFQDPSSKQSNYRVMHQYAPNGNNSQSHLNCEHPLRNACHINTGYVNSPPAPENVAPPEPIYGRQNYARLNVSNDTNYSDVYGQISHCINGGSSNFVRASDMAISRSMRAKKTVRIQVPDSDKDKHSVLKSSNDTSMDDITRRRQYRVGLNLFNQQPERGMEYLFKKSFLDYSPVATAKFLRGRKGLSRRMVGEYLCSLQRPFNLAVLHCFVHELDFTGLHLDIALRQLYDEVTFPGEAQKVEKMVEVFSRRYIQCNQMFVAGFNSPDTIFVLSYAMVLLNTDLHSKAVRAARRMRRDDFVRNLRGIDSGSDPDTDMLRGIYDRIKASEFKPGADHVSQVARLEDAIQGIKKKGGSVTNSDNCPLSSSQHRRLVCFCRLAEVPDMHKKSQKNLVFNSSKKDKDTAAHQRGVFLFNDMIVVAKTVTKGKKTSHQFRYSLQLRELRINVFSTNHYKYGIQLQDRLTGRDVATFNARSETDQQRFVNDIQEAAAEVVEMERANAMLNDLVADSETMC